MALIIDPTEVARGFRDEIRKEIAALGVDLKLVGFLATGYGPSKTYASYTERGCSDVGIRFDIREVNRFHLEEAIREANQDPSVHGIIIYYPIFGEAQDNYIKDQVDFRKDIEGLNTYWIRKLYNNERFDEQGRKAILPCTPLAIVKLLEAAKLFQPEDLPLRGKTVAIFNRSEVVGRPLASMLAHDGALVYSFDVHGPVEVTREEIRETSVTRKEALERADIVITGVPSKEFPLIQPDEIREGIACINFSTLKNFTDAAAEKAGIFIPRVGPMTVTMALRNTVRLYKNYHQSGA